MINKYKIYNLDLDNQFKCFFKFFIENKENFDLKECLPIHLRESFNLNINTLNLEVNKLDKKHNYVKKTNQYEELINSLQESFIDNLAYKAFMSLEKNKTIISNIKTFKPTNGKCKPPEYKLFSNTSGRLTIENGRNILTLPRRCRNIFKSKSSKGKLLSLDFNNLEPRIALKLSGKDQINDDLYQYIIDHLNLDVDRSIVKNIVISILYGMNTKEIEYFSKEKYQSLKNHIKNIFALEEILILSKNTDEFGIRRNYYGKPLWNKKEERNHVLINNYIQSTAVDVAMSYFYNLINLVDNNLCRPIFLIHDAIVFDVDPNYEEELKRIVQLGCEDHFLGKFPLSLSIFNKEL